MYSYEERLRAVELYLKLGKRPKAVIRQLGYPMTKNSLRAWYEEFEKRGDLVPGYVRQKPKYSDEQKSAAIEHYINHGRRFTFTIKSLGYPCRDTLREWVCERHPETRKCVVGKTGQPVASLASKRAAVYELCTREGSAEAVAQRLDVNRGTLYNWKNQLLGREAPVSMKNDKQKTCGDGAGRARAAGRIAPTRSRCDSRSHPRCQSLAGLDAELSSNSPWFQFNGKHESASPI